jgi:thymidylate synthase
MPRARYHDNEYLNLVAEILDDGEEKGDRTGTGTRSLFAKQMRFDLSGGSIPLLTTKKMFTRGIIHEILWYLKGDTNIKYLTDNNVHIWDEWADENGDLGPVYGEQWRRWKYPTGTRINYETDPPQAEIEWGTIDQIAQIIHQLRTNPNDRRIIVNAWNVGELDQMKLPPCHMAFQFWSVNGKLKCHLYQRSCDVGLGVPFNIVQYSILTHMVAQVVGMEADEFIWTGGDCHIYNNHIDMLNEQCEREPYPSPYLDLNPHIKEIDDFTYDDFTIVGYNKFHETIKMEVAV